MTPGRLALLGVTLAVAVNVPACALFHHDRTPAKPAPIDLNRASLRKVEGLPGVTPSMARRIVDGRPYDDPQELVARGILTERELDRIADRVTVEHRDR